MFVKDATGPPRIVSTEDITDTFLLSQLIELGTGAGWVAIQPHGDHDDLVAFSVELGPLQTQLRVN